MALIWKIEQLEGEVCGLRDEVHRLKEGREEDRVRSEEGKGKGNRSEETGNGCN